MRGEAEFEALGQVYARRPIRTPCRSAPRPGVERLRKVLAEEKIRARRRTSGGGRRSCRSDESPQLPTSVTRKGIALARSRRHTGRRTRIGRAEIGIDLVVRRSQIKLSPTPIPALGEKQPLLRLRGRRRGRSRGLRALRSLRSHRGLRASRALRHGGAENVNTRRNGNRHFM